MRDTLHELKTDPEWFAALWEGRKTCEIRRDDRGFRVGDRLHLFEYDRAAARPSGRWVEHRITHILRDLPQYGLTAGFAVLSLGPRLSSSVDYGGE